MFNIDSISKVIGFETLTTFGKFKIVGLYDNSNGLYYILYNKKQVSLYNVISSPLPILSTNTLKEINSETFINDKKEEFKNCKISYKNNVLYIKNIFDKPQKLSYIYTNDNIYKFDTELNIQYDAEKEQFTYINELFNINLSNENYYYLFANIKKEYIKLCKKFLESDLSAEQLKQFMSEFVFCGEYSTGDN